MTQWLANVSRLHDTCFDTFGELGTLTPPDSAPVVVRAIVDEETTLRGELGEVIDPRPSVTLDRRVVGDRPKGALAVDGRSWTLDKVIDGGDRYEVRVYLRPVVSS